jgi:hypothetical protein
LTHSQRLWTVKTAGSIARARTLARSAAARLRAWFEPPLEDDARPLEIRHAILDRVEQLAEPAAAGRRVLPRNRIVVTVLAPDEQSRDLLGGALVDIDEAIRTRLGELRCPLPHGFCVDTDFVEERRPDWRQGQRFAVELAHAAGGRPAPTTASSASARGASEPAAPVPTLHIAVTKGAASETTYVFSEVKVLIGRTPAPIDRAGRPRYNHIVFLDEGDEHNATVGRAHATIQFLADRHQFRLFDDGSHNGTRIVRRGETIDVMPHNPVGVALLSGDEIQFGTAAIVVTIEDGV